MKRFLIAGLLFWVPVGATLAVLRFVVNTMDALVAWLPQPYHPNHWLGYPIPGLSFVLVLLILWGTGVLITNFIGQHILQWWESLLSHVPLVRSVYQAVKQSMEVILSSQGDSFRQVLLVEYPRKGCWSLAFRTSDALPAANEAVGEPMVSVFVPTTPNPTSGFLLMLPRSDIRTVNMSVDQALKYIVSLGTVMLPNQKETLS